MKKKILIVSGSVIIIGLIFLVIVIKGIIPTPGIGLWLLQSTTNHVSDDELIAKIQATFDSLIVSEKFDSLVSLGQMGHITPEMLSDSQYIAQLRDAAIAKSLRLLGRNQTIFEYFTRRSDFYKNGYANHAVGLVCILDGDTATGLKFIERSLALGCDRLADVSESKDFDMVRSDPRWASYVEEARRLRRHSYSKSSR